MPKDAENKGATGPTGVTGYSYSSPTGPTGVTGATGVTGSVPAGQISSEQAAAENQARIARGEQPVVANVADDTPDTVPSQEDLVPTPPPLTAEQKDYIRKTALPGVTDEPEGPGGRSGVTGRTGATGATGRAGETREQREQRERQEERERVSR